MGLLPISVTITNKFTTIAAGAAAVTLHANVQIDTNSSGVTWTLTSAGAATTDVTYTPPATLAAAPNNAPTVTATSVKDTSKSDSDSFTMSAPAIFVTSTTK